MKLEKLRYNYGIHEKDLLPIKLKLDNPASTQPLKHYAD